MLDPALVYSLQLRVPRKFANLCRFGADSTYTPLSVHRRMGEPAGGAPPQEPARVKSALMSGVFERARRPRAALSAPVRFRQSGALACRQPGGWPAPPPITVPLAFSPWPVSDAGPGPVGAGTFDCSSRPES